MGFAATLDMYRKVPSDLLEGTKKGSFFSLCAVFSMATLFFLETRAFLKTYINTDLHLDDNFDTKLRVNFNITMLDLACEYAVVDVVSFLGTEQNITAHINKWSLDAEGVKDTFKGRNKNQKDILLSDETVTETIEILHRNGEQVENLDPRTLEEDKLTHKYLFVDFFAPWCSHCQVLAPTWEALGELTHEVAFEEVDEMLSQHYPEGDHDYTEEDYLEAMKLTKPVQIGKVDCEEHKDLCENYRIVSYPTIRLYLNGKFHSDYDGDRTIMAFTHYLNTVEKDNEQLADAETNADGVVNKSNERAKERGAKVHHDRLWNEKRLLRQWRSEDHPGCQLTGFLQLDRVPGNFYIMASSNQHNLAPSLTNVSHIVNQLYFGDPSMKRRAIQDAKPNTPDDLYEKLDFVNASAYVTQNAHSAYHHHLKVVATNFEYGSYGAGLSRQGKAYQMLVQSQITRYGKHEIPSAKFVYDLSPIGISYRKHHRKWYDYMTSIMAIIGGTFTVFGMLESSLHAATQKNR